MPWQTVPKKRSVSDKDKISSTNYSKLDNHDHGDCDENGEFLRLFLFIYFSSLLVDRYNYWVKLVAPRIYLLFFSVAKATLHSQMSVFLSVCSSTFNLYLSTFILHHFVTLKLLLITCKVDDDAWWRMMTLDDTDGRTNNTNSRVALQLELLPFTHNFSFSSPVSHFHSQPSWFSSWFFSHCPRHSSNSNFRTSMLSWAFFLSIRMVHIFITKH